jgi:parallel beta-helix repeat protein
MWGDHLLKKSLDVGIIFFLVISIVPYSTLSNEISTSTFDGNILYVGGSGLGNYSIIQDAIDNASDGDTVFVFSGTYFENVVVDKSIDLIGEDRENTFVDGNESGGHVVNINANRVNIAGFTIQNCGGIPNAAGVFISSKNNRISGNHINCIPHHGEEGIWLYHSSGNILSGNTITNHHYGIWLEDSTNNNISENYITNNWNWAIILGYCKNNGIIGNIIVNNSGGIYLRDSTENNLSGNEISNNYRGITLADQETSSSHNKITRNNFRENGNKNAFFIIAEKSHSKNTWDENYWNRPLIHPKLIIGSKKFIRFPAIPFHFPGFWITIPWINIDWHPALKPYDIS